jgi:hypothetical protein
MNRLPKVLQTEIWEYVRGDRKFWMTRFKEVMEDLDYGERFRLVRVKYIADGFTVHVLERPAYSSEHGDMMTHSVSICCNRSTVRSFIWDVNKQHRTPVHDTREDANIAAEFAIGLVRTGTWNEPRQNPFDLVVANGHISSTHQPISMPQQQSEIPISCWSRWRSRLCYRKPSHS